MSEIIHINEELFREEVLEAETPVLVDFSAVWCGPCKMLDPLIAELARAWGDKVKVVKVDIDNNPDLAIQYQVMGVPTLLMFVNGKPRERAVGYQPKKRLEARFGPFVN